MAHYHGSKYWREKIHEIIFEAAGLTKIARFLFTVIESTTRFLLSKN